MFFPENFENRIRKLTSLIIQGKIFVETIFLERFDVKRFFFFNNNNNNIIIIISILEAVRKYLFLPLENRAISLS